MTFIHDVRFTVVFRGQLETETEAEGEQKLEDVTLSDAYNKSDEWYADAYDFSKR